jgi:hypothetical protein
MERLDDDDLRVCARVIGALAEADPILISLGAAARRLPSVIQNSRDVRFIHTVGGARVVLTVSINLADGSRFRWELTIEPSRIGYETVGAFIRQDRPDDTALVVCEVARRQATTLDVLLDAAVEIARQLLATISDMHLLDH